MSDTTIEQLPKAIVASCPRLPRRLDYYSESTSTILISLVRGHELRDLSPPGSVHITVLSGKVLITNPFSSRKLERFDEMQLIAGVPWTLQVLQSCDFLLVDGALSATDRSDKISEFSEQTPFEPRVRHNRLKPQIEEIG